MADLRASLTLLRRSEAWWIENAFAMSGVSATGQEQTVQAPSGRWRGRTTFAVNTPEEVLSLRGFLFSLDGAANPFLIGPKDLAGRPTVAYTLAAAAAAGDTQITLRRTVADVLVRGPYFALGERMHAISRLPAVDAGDPGDVLVEIRPWLRQAHSVGQAVNFASPRLRMKLVPASASAAIERIARSESEVPLEFVEAF
ncbi:hypothetical protein HNR00_003594 [Methylorubrum rhodinum]|uniref:Uncharacterized protein n=1 Tax=Methylorubrum rhodinum TaxID=29428 RepID=A0A840ZPR7_9HYPH|nr:hypothetical protein [Methylorubrum rhodinum]MBB5758867.1 hypothetical protein [Methylorubrum rhodinum]